MLAYCNYHVDGWLHPKIEIFGPSGEFSTTLLFIMKLVHGVTLESYTWGSAGTLIAAERCLFAPNMFVNMGLTKL